MLGDFFPPPFLITTEKLYLSLLALCLQFSVKHFWVSAHWSSLLPSHSSRSSASCWRSGSAPLLSSSSHPTSSSDRAVVVAAAAAAAPAVVPLLQHPQRNPTFPSAWGCYVSSLCSSSTSIAYWWEKLMVPLGGGLLLNTFSVASCFCSQFNYCGQGICDSCATVRAMTLMQGCQTYSIRPQTGLLWSARWSCKLKENPKAVLFPQ